MQFISGVAYNLRGLRMGLKTPLLLVLGLARFVLIIGFTLIATGLVFSIYEAIFDLIWKRPEREWVVWLCTLASWLFGIFLAGLSVIVSFLVSQVFFSVVIMDFMSRLTEQRITGGEQAAEKISLIRRIVYLILQEIPRGVLPVLISLAVMALGWLTPFSPILTPLSTAFAAIFLAWDNTDLIPARRLHPLRDRLRFLRENIPFHLGFGILFLIPFFNILFLSFAPVGATLYYIDRDKKRASA